MKRFLALLLAAASMQAATYCVTVAGLGGEADYEQRFTSWAREMETVLKSSGGSAVVETLSGANATKTRLNAALERIAKQAQPDDAFMLVLIGHGTFDGIEYKFNIPGPDITAEELAVLLDRIPATRQLVVNTTSASGASLGVLRKQNRVIITATKSGAQKNATVFARYWIEALRDPTADTDKNEVISALEAYLYADQKVTKFFDSQKRLATEHAIFEDTGKGEGVRAAALETGAGQMAGAFTVVRFGHAQAQAADPAKRPLFERKEEIEQQIDGLKYRKAAMDSREYRDRLAKLLIELATLEEELEK